MENTKEYLVKLLEGAHFAYLHELGDGKMWNRIADHLIAHGVTVQDNTEISEELLQQLKNAPITILHEEPTIEVVQKWIPVSERLPMMGKVGEFVLAYTRENKHIIVTCWAVHKHRDQIIAWQPLPQPPKGKG